MVIPLCFAAMAFGQGAHSDPRDVIIDVDAPTSYVAALDRAEHLKQHSAKEPIQIEILSHGKGIGMLSSGGKFGKRMAADAKAGVVFAACSKSMAHSHLDKMNLYPFATVVDSGSAELARKKKAGWTVVKPAG